MSWKFKFAFVALAALAIFIGLAALVNSYNYSIGTRTGVIDKLSTKGFICWTREGQLALANFAKSDSLTQNKGAIDNTFYFSVPDKTIEKELEAIPPGSAVSLEYHQKLFPLALPLPLMCHRRTEYEIVGVKLAPAYPPNTPAPVRP
ncbi:hypothetical protein [Methylocella silvestris]|uniref:Uncharacterized protein n=1 Tax=Methylocella silvestris TaxID=199596 RepID=A0A2J7TGI8_METSI|nr:hypothetical protein [Methylocella silvestris]PNG25877.1 hypothetical protein CR492_11115 [Methylocella silvestris]